MVAYSFYDSLDWYKISLQSFKDYLPNIPLLIVDHNRRPHESKYFQQFGEVIQHDNPQKHGNGIDAAVAYCKNNAYDILVHIEPDCVIRGTTWFNELIKAIEEGYWMSGTHFLDFGAIHPCPSAWKVSEIKHSFSVCTVENDRYHPRYNELINVPVLARMLGIPTYNPQYWLHHWDCGIKNWFECAIEDKAKLCKAWDFYHFWCGRKNKPGDLLPEIQSFLSPYWNCDWLI